MRTLRYKPWIRLVCLTLALSVPAVKASDEGIGRRIQSFFGFDNEYKFDPEEYDQIREVALRLLEACPPPDCGIVALGRSPTAIAALLDILQPGSVTFLPLSSFKHLPHNRGGNSYFDSLPKELLERFVWLVSKYIPAFNPLSDAEEERLFAHFQYFFPTNRKRLMFFDISLYGFSLIAAVKYAEKYFSKHPNPPQIDAAMVIDTDHPETETDAFFRSQNIEPPLVMRVDPFSHLRRKFIVSAYDSYAPYGAYNVVESRGEPPEPNEKRYQAFKASLKKQMVRLGCSGVLSSAR